MKRPTSISKVMSANDIGKTASHQAGMLIPKDERILAFFPKLARSEYNPRQHIRFRDEAGQFWEFAFIWYNNALDGRGGTRNEYRLTRMTKFLSGLRLEPGDILWMQRDGDEYRIGARRMAAGANGSEVEAGEDAPGSSPPVRLTGGWVVVKL